MQNKLTKQISDLSQGLLRLEEAVALDSNLIVQDATIQRFEFCFEMSWKLLQTIVHDMGIEAYGPKNVIRSAANASLLDSAEDWLHFAEMRNLACTPIIKKLQKKYMLQQLNLCQWSKNF